MPARERTSQISLWRVLTRLLGVLRTEGPSDTVSAARTCIAKGFLPCVLDHISDQSGNKRSGHLRPTWNNLVTLGHFSARGSNAASGLASQLDLLFSPAPFLFSLAHCGRREFLEKLPAYEPSSLFPRQPIAWHCRRGGTQYILGGSTKSQVPKVKQD